MKSDRQQQGSEESQSLPFVPTIFLTLHVSNSHSKAGLGTEMGALAHGKEGEKWEGRQ